MSERPNVTAACACPHHCTQHPPPPHGREWAAARTFHRAQAELRDPTPVIRPRLEEAA